MKKIDRKYNVLDAMRSVFIIQNLIDTVKYKIEFNKNHPDYFKPDGILTFVGSQGDGKTLSAVQYIKKLMDNYPKCILVSNVHIKGYEDRTYPFDGVNRFRDYSNGEYGVIYFIDEIHILFNSLESKGFDINLFETISQQRKQRKHIVGCTQVFQRMAKGFREQFKYVVVCRCFFNVFQFNRIAAAKDCIVDESTGKMTMEKNKLQMFFHSPAMYDMYDTTALIDRTVFNYEWNEKKEFAKWNL